MCNQFVLKGGSFATPKVILDHHIEIFIILQIGWQFSGLRLASDIKD